MGELPGVKEHVAAGGVLFVEGSRDDGVYLVEDGEFEVIQRTAGTETLLGRLGDGDVIGEITAVLGGRRTATVRASSDATVRRMTTDEFRTWLAEDPERNAAIRGAARSRMDHTRLASVLARLIGPGRPEVVDEINSHIEWTWVEAGDALFRQGDASDAAYILMAGQMRITATEIDESTGEPHVVLDTRSGRGELIGELGIIDNAPRSATVTAIRDCSLGRLSREAFATLTAKYPTLMLQVARSVLQRTATSKRVAPHAGAIALAMLSPAVTPAFAKTISDEIARFGPTQLVNPDIIERFLHRSDAANAESGTGLSQQVSDLLHEVDVAHRWTLLETDPDTTVWTRRALRTADRIVLVVSARPDAEERRRLAACKAVIDAIGDVDLWLAQLNPAGTTKPTGAAELLALSGASRAIQVVDGEERTVRRLARLISGNGLGLALGGGGARSLAHIGVLRSFDELDIEIDTITGTSMGSVVGSFMALVDSYTVCQEYAEREFPRDVKLLDKTLPFTSIFSGRLIANSMVTNYGPTQQIEDMRVPFACLATNLTSAKLVTHRQGSLVTAVRSSMALPGAFPPVVSGTDLLVDGGVMENLPVSPLVADAAVSTIIAVDVTPPDGPKAHSDYGLSLSGVDIARSKMSRGKSPGYPALTQVVMNSILVASAQARQQAISGTDIDLYLSLNLKGVKLLDLGELEHASARGYQESLPRLTAWLEANPARRPR